MNDFEKICRIITKFPRKNEEGEDCYEIKKFRKTGEHAIYLPRMIHIVGLDYILIGMETLLALLQIGIKKSFGYNPKDLYLLDVRHLN